jgi:hypothetical protein
MTDVIIYRSRTLALVKGVSDRGTDWIKKNISTFREGHDTLIHQEYAMDLAADLQKAGLDVDLT